jgi:hypothetical protein
VQTDRVAAYKQVCGKLLANPDDARSLVERQYFVQASKRARELNVSLARRAFELAPDRFEAVFNLASAELPFDPWNALEGFKRAFDLAPRSHKATAMHHMGLAYHDLGRIDEALRSYEGSKALDPHEPEIERSIAIADLSAGRLAEGLFSFEVEHYQAWDRPIFKSGIPRWRGEDLTGKTIIVAHEQGFGDSIQFCRFIPHIKAGKVLWSGPDVLTGLIEDNIKLDGTVPFEGPFDADYHASPLSACAALGIDYPSVDHEPYIVAEPMKLPDRGRLKVGLVWRGSSGYARDADRSFDIDTYAPLFEIPGCAFYSLQVGEFANDVHDAGLTGFVADLTPAIKDWRDTAKALAAMDVLVSIDTATAHLAGAMGIKTLLLLNFAPCWRWMRDTETTPWYKNHKLYRQHMPGEWREPVASVARQLRMMVNGRK